MQTLSFTGPYSIYTSYKTGDYVLYAGKLYKCLLENSSTTPQNATYWQLVSNKYTMKGSWQTNTRYYIGESVIYNNVGYICLANTSVSNQSPDTETSFWRVFNNNYQNIVTKQPGDLQYEGNTSPQRLPIGNTNQILSISSQGYPAWANQYPSGLDSQVLTLTNGTQVWSNTFYEVATNNVYYVAKNGIDNANRGNTINTPWATIKYATQNVPNNSTIFVKTGTYNEQLSITIPPGVSIVGDSVRGTIVQPASGNTGTMFLMSDSTMVTNMTVKGMTGFTATGNNISTSTLSGAFFALNPNSPIANKSPYIKDVSTISSGGIGVLVDGSVHNSGYKSILTDGVTCINDNGAGFIATNGGRLEAVSSFTYYSYYGFGAANGATIRTMDCNNAYGTYGISANGTNTLVRLNAHEFMSVGTGGIVSTNYPGTPLTPSNLLNQVISANGASVYYVSMDENDNLSIGSQFKITTSNGSITNANTINAVNVNVTNVITTGNVTIGGNLFVQGTTTTVNTDIFQNTEYANVIIANTTTSNVITANVITANTFNNGGILTTSSLSVANTTTIHQILESANVQAVAAGSTMNIYFNSGSVFYYTANATSNMTFNFVYDGVTTLNNTMSIGQTVSCAILVTQGGTAYYPTTFNIDGTSVTVKWPNGAAPSSGDTNSIDVYTFSIIKTASATYTVLGSAAKFA